MSRRRKNKGHVPFEKMPSTLIGRKGEKIIETALPFGEMCWRYAVCAGRCECAHNRLNTETTAQAGKADADIVVSFKCCDNAGNRCKFLKDGDIAEFVSLHEVKTNPAAVDASIAGFSAHTENLYVEMVQHEDNYIWAYRDKLMAESKGEAWGKDIDGYRKELDPLEDNSAEEHYVEYLNGVGWWPKRKYSYERGKVSYLHAGWYHFYQPYDTWEWVKKKRGEYNAKGYKEARKSEIEKFLSDENIEDGSILLVQYPVEICISIAGEHLEKIIDKNIDVAINQGVCIPVKSKKYADNGYDLHYKGSSGNPLVLGYVMPIEKLIPCTEVNKRTERIKAGQPIEYMTGLSGVRTMVIGKFVQKGGNHTPIKTAIPMNTRKIYAPRRIMGKAIKGGMLLYPLKPFERELYNPQHKKYVPRVIEEFAYHVKPYV